MAARHVESLIRAQRSLDKALVEKTKGARRGLIKAGIFILGESQRETPIDTGNLRASGYVIWDTALDVRLKRKDPSVEKADVNESSKQLSNFSQRLAARTNPSRGKFVVEVGYVASYAVFVHEGVDMNFNKGKAKFLSDPVNRNHLTIIRLVQEEDKKVSGQLRIRGGFGRRRKR